jgi:hypothetical protein
MDYFLIFSYEILKLNFFLNFSGLTRFDQCNPGHSSLIGSIFGSGLITILISQFNIINFLKTT